MKTPHVSFTHASAFPDTQWSLIRRSQDAANPEALAALDRLARAYWRPLHAFARAFMIACLRNSMPSTARERLAQKRGGCAEQVPLDEALPWAPHARRRAGGWAHVPGSVSAMRVS